GAGLVHRGGAEGFDHKGLSSELTRCSSGSRFLAPIRALVSARSFTDSRNDKIPWFATPAIQNRDSHPNFSKGGAIWGPRLLGTHGLLSNSRRRKPMGHPAALLWDPDVLGIGRCEQLTRKHCCEFAELAFPSHGCSLGPLI